MSVSLYIRIASLALVFGYSGCFIDPSIPSCEILADCPVGQGFTGCIDGWCYFKDACESRPVEAGDGCCALTEGDRSVDTDCLLQDIPLSCLYPAGPTVDDIGNLFVSCLMTDAEGGHNVAMRRLDPDGVLSVPVVAGTGSVALNPVMGPGATFFIQTGDSIVRYRSDTLVSIDSMETVTPLAPMASNNGSVAYRTISSWPGDDGRVHMFDEDPGVVFAYGLPRPELAESGAFRPTVSWTGRRTYVTWKNGVLDVIETGSNPLGVVLSASLPALPAGPAIDVDGLIYVLLVNGKLTRYQENAMVRLDEDWSLEIFDGLEEQGAWLLVREDNLIVLVSRSGKVQVVRDMDTFGSIVATGGFNDSLADIHPVLAESGRITAVSSSGRIVSVLTDDERGEVYPGLEFSLPSWPASDLILVGNSLVYVSETGSLMSWSYPDGPGIGRWSRSSGNNGSTARTSSPDRSGVVD